MIDWIGSGSMSGEATGPDPVFSDLTIEVPTGDVVAAAAFSGFSMGVLEHQPGEAGVFVREYGQFDPSGRPNVVDVPSFPANGVFAIPRCFFVRFRMMVLQGNAYARGLVFRLAPEGSSGGSKPPAWSVRDYRIQVGGKGDGTHRVMALARGSRLAGRGLDALLARSGAEAARFFGVRRSKVEVSRARRRSSGPRLV